MDLTENIELEVIEFLKETIKAVQVKLHCGVYWIPKSQCRIIKKKIYITRWFADKNGIDYLSCDITNNLF